jgi:NAD(P)-dependent dehydrogenase (short-subunit alcohol dehydrogenase family)
MKLANKICVVTGGNRGIGRSISELFSKNGASVIILARDEESGEEVEKIINKSNDKCIFIKTDIKNRDEVIIAIDKIIKKFRKIDILVNNAGIIKRTPFLEISIEEWNEIMDTNLTGTFICCQEVLRHMIKRKEGNIINITSFCGKTGRAYQSHYSASKAGIIALTQSLAREFGSYGIRVNAIQAGRTKTELIKPFMDTELERWKSETPLGRIATPDDIAKVALFLACDDSSYVIGETLAVNGGIYMD